MEATVYNTVEPRMIPLPEDLRGWAEDNKPMLFRLSTVVTEKPTLSEHALWELIAAEYSPEWMHARTSLKNAQAKLDDVLSPLNMPLGLIGEALHSDETNLAKRMHTAALVGFTVINETLRAEERLSKLLDALKDHAHTIHQSLELSRNAASMTAEFASVATVEPEPVSAASGFGKVAGRFEERPRKPEAQKDATPKRASRGGPLTTSFLTLGAKLFGAKAATPAPKQKKPDNNF
ncbi:MAG: hypothetical protein PW788_00375 [Micavibrio sp.]|nr:hypothetical protein [Micavibrio sp.]